MSNTILISGSSETISLTVQPQVAGVNLSISEAVGTNTVEINQFAGDYVSTIEGGSGIDVSSVGTVTTVSLASDISSFETDPVFTASPAGSITSTQVSNWDTAYNDSIESLSFDTSTGVLTATQVDDGTLTVALDGRYVQLSEFNSDFGSITDQYLPKYDNAQDVFVDSKIYEETDKLIISTSNLDSTAAAKVEFGDGITTTYSLDGTFTAVEVSRDDDVEYNRASAVFDTSDNKYYEVYQNTASYLLGGTPINYISVSLAVYNNDGSKDSETVIFSDQSHYETINPLCIKVGDKIVFTYRREVSSQNYETKVILYDITDDEAATPISLPDVDYISSPTINAMYWSESLSKLFLVGIREIFKYDIVNDALVLDEASTEENGATFHTIFEHSGGFYAEGHYGLVPYNESTNTFGTRLWTSSFVDDGEGTQVETGVTVDAVYINGEVWSVSNETSGGVSYRYLTYYSFTNDERYIIENLNPESSTEELSAKIFYSADQGLVYASMGVDVHVYNASTKEKVETITLDPSNTLFPLEAIGSYSLYGGDHIYPLGKQSVIPSSFSDNATVKLDFTYGDYTQIGGDSAVDPQSVLALIDQGLVYGAKSPDAVSHHFFTNNFSTGNYERVLSIGPETLYVFNTSGENSTVTKTKIDNWDSAGPAVETAAFNTATGDLTLTLTDASTVVANLDGRYLQTEENDFVTAASLGVDNVLTLTVSNQDDVTVSLSSLVVSDTNDFLTTASFTNGTLTLGVSNQSDVTVSLDGRYLQSETLTSLSFLNDTLTYTDENGTANGIDLSIYNETNTSLTFNGETSVLTYTDEDGTANAVDISSLEETNTSLTFNGETSVLTYTDEEGTANAVDISSLEETLTSLSFSSETNSLTYTDEDGTENAVSIDALSETLTSLSYNGTNQTLTYTDEDGTDNVLDISETTTSISFTGDTLTYTDEDGTDTDISLAKYNETLTSLTFANDTLTYTNEDSTANTIDLSIYNETLTSLAYSSGTLTYTDEDGTDTALDISGLSGDTTYDLSSAANATEGADIKLVGSDTTTDSINVVGTNAVTVTGAAGTITIDAPEETLTSLSYANDTLTYTDEDGTSTDINLAGFNETLTSLSIASNILTYTDEDGTETDIDLSLYLDDTNLARLTSGTLDGATGIATFTRDDATTFTVDFSDLLDDTDTDTTYDLSTKNNATAGIDLDLTAGGDGSGTDTVTFKGANAVTVTQASNVVTIDVPNGVNDFVDGATFNTANGELTLSVGNQSDVVVDLDGRYLQSYSETDTLDSVATRGNTTDQSIKIGEDGGTPDTELHVVGAITIEGDTAVSGTLTNVAISQNINSDLTSYSAGQDSFLSWANNFDIADKTVYKKIAGSGVAQYFISSGSAASAYDNFERHLRIDSSVTNPHFIRWDIGQWSGTGDTYKDISSTTGSAFSIGRLSGVGARTELFRLDVDGDLTISGGYGNQSSIKYKKNVQDLEDRTEDVMSLRPVRYELKANDKKDIGFIAEEVAEIFPEVIGYKDGEVNSIDYSRLTVVLLQQVQKQQSMIDALSERITKLEK